MALDALSADRGGLRHIGKARFFNFRLRVCFLFCLYIGRVTIIYTRFVFLWNQLRYSIPGVLTA